MVAARAAHESSRWAWHMVTAAGLPEACALALSHGPVDALHARAWWRDGLRRGGRHSHHSMVCWGSGRIRDALILSKSDTAPSAAGVTIGWARNLQAQNQQGYKATYLS